MRELTDWSRDGRKVLYEMCEVLCQTEEAACLSCILWGTGINEGYNLLIICTNAICRKEMTKEVNG